jgi:ketosteroid isomerase-like protein
MHRFRGATVVVLAITCGRFAPVARAEPVREAIERGNRAVIAACLRGDARGVADCYTADAQIFPPGGPVAKGRAAIVEFWQKSIDAGIKEFSLKTDDVESGGDLACETGTARMVDNAGGVLEARYVVVWKRVAGAWKLHRDIWNSANPSPPR